MNQETSPMRERGDMKINAPENSKTEKLRQTYLAHYLYDPNLIYNTK